MNTINESVSKYEVCLINQEDLHKNQTRQLTPGKSTVFQDVVQKLFVVGTFFDFEKSCVNQWERHVPGVGKVSTLQICKSYEVIERTRALELTDCSINTTCKKSNKNYVFKANLSVLGSTSKVIFDMVKDLKQSCDISNPLELGILFQGFPSFIVYTYLCYAYNPGLKFMLLEDVLCILQLAIKLDNQVLIKNILDMRVLYEMMQFQTQIYDGFDSPCHLLYVLDFALKHSFNRLVVLCEYCILSKNLTFFQVNQLPQISRTRLLMFFMQRPSNNQTQFYLQEYQAFYGSLIQNK
eukprot:TRINITY_DN612_c0_g1_i15.p2 TRINITY_DN612_c0_g1~~TRINITY_DN612_c0_g1_i15.p2  ORF type:complete len:295 (-),score=10.21 TRINITY_DN612_c0_g1_i15:676-1560(-)